MRVIKNPRWLNEAKTQINCEFHYPDGQILRAVVSQTEQGNPDWEEIMTDFGVDGLDKATEEYFAHIKARREAQEQRRKEQMETAKTEALFNAKLEAFMIEDIKNSKNTTLKSKIRKAKTLTEVIVYTTILLQEELNKPVEAQTTVEPPVAPVVDEPVKAKRGRKKKTEI